MTQPIPLTVHQFEPIEHFRAEKRLPRDFGVRLFQPKNYAGLGSIYNAGESLRQLHDAVICAVPADIPPLGWQVALIKLQVLFQAKLREINSVIGLRQTEIDYAVNGFGEVTQRYLYALLSARMRRHALPTFDEVYVKWLDSTIVYTREFIRFLQEETDEVWQVQVAAHAFGRFGLIVQTPEETRYVLDPTIACPAEAFMVNLFREVAGRLQLAINTEQLQTGSAT
jgi:hypothetical protein